MGDPAGKTYLRNAANDAWISVANGSGSGGSGSGGSGTATMPLGYNFGVYITYKDADEIYVQPGNIDVNGTDVSVTTATAHTMTSMVNATEDFHYIYLAAAGTITDSATEPAWSDAKFGWYNDDTRCIGVVWVPSATPAILMPFNNNVENEWLAIGSAALIKQLVTSGNPNGDWQDITTASDYSPVNAYKIWGYIYAASTGAYASAWLSAIEDKNYYEGIGATGTGWVVGVGWVNLGESRDLAWWGEDNDDNATIVRLMGYKIRV